MTGVLADGVYKIVGANSSVLNSFWDLSGSESGAGVIITGNTETDFANQKWDLVYWDYLSAYTIKNMAAGTFASTYQTRSPDPGYKVLQSDVSRDWFYIQPAQGTGDGYNIFPKLTGGVVDIKSPDVRWPELIFAQLGNPPVERQQWLFLGPLDKVEAKPQGSLITQGALINPLPSRLLSKPAAD